MQELLEKYKVILRLIIEVCDIKISCKTTHTKIQWRVIYFDFCAMKKTALVTWWAGFVWSHLCKKLLDEWYKVICVDNLYTWSKNNIASISDNQDFSFVEHDVIETLTVSDTIDEIYHLACPASPVHYQKDPIYTWKTSVFGMYNMLTLATEKNAKILFSSTSEVYWDPEIHPQPESYRGKVNMIWIRSCYDEWKRAAETICMDFHKTHWTKIKIIRIFNTYGPYMDKDDGRVVSNFIRQALENETITMYGDWLQTRSFQYIDDLIHGICAMMQSDDSVIWPINIWTQFEFTMKQLAEKILSLIPESTSTIEYLPLPSDDPKQRKANNDLAKDLLWREPRVKLDEWLIHTISYFAFVLQHPISSIISERSKSIFTNQIG